MSDDLASMFRTNPRIPTTRCTYLVRLKDGSTLTIVGTVIVYDPSGTLLIYDMQSAEAGAIAFVAAEGQWASCQRLEEVP